MRPRPFAVGLLVLVLCLAAVPLLGGARAAPPTPTSPPMSGNLTGPSLLGTQANATYRFNATGGPAFLGSTQIGQLSWKASLAGANLTGTSVAPSNGTITAATSLPVTTVVTAGKHAETLTLTVVVTSSLAGNNSTLNLTRTIHVVLPYTIQATLVAGAAASVLPFNVTVALDGKNIGVVQVPQLAPKATYQLVYRYATLSLASGPHTFTLKIADAHGLVTFSNGRTVLSTSFYVAPPPSNNTVWYVAGVVAFFGVLFIYATRVAARRRGAARR